MPSTPLALSVVEFVGRLKRTPALAGDPAFLEELLRDAKEDMQDAFVSLATPKANDTWETSVVLPGATLTSPVAPLSFPKPVRIIGMIPIIVPVDPFPGGVAVINRATLEDVLVQVTVDKETQYTSQEDGSSTTTNGPSNFVTAKAVDIMLPRLWDAMIESSNPKVEFVWQWKQGANVFVDSICSMACLLQWKSPRTQRWGNKERR